MLSRPDVFSDVEMYGDTQVQHWAKTIVNSIWERHLPVFNVLLCKFTSAWHFMSVWALSTTLTFSFDKETANWSPVPLQHMWTLTGMAEHQYNLSQ